MGTKTSKENVVRVCDRISGSIGRRTSLPNGNFPVNTARPRAAETPHKNAADPIKKYPRSGCERDFSGFLFTNRNSLRCHPERSRFSGGARDLTATSACHDNESRPLFI